MCKRLDRQQIKFYWKIINVVVIFVYKMKRAKSL